MNKTTNNLLNIETISEGKSILALPVGARAGGLLPGGFFIISSALSTTQHEQKLTRLAEVAYGQRNMPALERLSAELCGMPSDSARDAGLYYVAIIAKRKGQFDYARSILESLIESPTLRARAIQTLGALFYDAGNVEQAMPLFTEAARSNDLYVKYIALMQVSSVKSLAGEHRAAVEDIEQLLPLARVVAFAQSHLFYSYHNELAYELAQVGRLQEAVRHSEIACASPVASAYTEWQETREEIAAAFVEQEQKPLVFVVPDLQREGKPQHPQVLCACRSFISIRRSPISAAPVMKRSPRAPTIIERISLCVLIHAPPFTSEA
jgi:hypothetical protein